MKVALYIGNAGPTSGGGYTYESDIAQSVGDLRRETHHEIVTIGTSPLPPPGWDARSHVSLQMSLGRRVLGKATREIKRVATDRHRIALTRIDTLLAGMEVDFVWCLSLGTPTRQLPYASTVWDLQHRLQPIFPEVSADGEWARRERALSRVLGQATIVIVGTDAGQAEVERFYDVPQERIRKLPHPTPTFALRAPDSDLTSGPPRGVREPFVVYPAQFWAHKNHVGLLRAVAILRDRHDTRLHLAFVGSDMGNEAHVRRVAHDLDLEGQVQFLGFVSREVLVSLYRKALALAYVSYFGPENLPPLEAFALGCPVVAADVPGAREQLGDAALLVVPTDPQAIADALLSVLRDESLRRDLVSRGHVRAASYTTEKYALDMFHILNQIEPVVRTWR